MFGTLEKNWLSKTAQFLGGKSANELLYSLQNVELLNPRRIKSIQYSRLKFLGTVNRALVLLHVVTCFNCSYVSHLNGIVFIHF